MSNALPRELAVYLAGPAGRGVRDAQPVCFRWNPPDARHRVARQGAEEHGRADVTAAHDGVRQNWRSRWEAIRVNPVPPRRQ